MKITEKKFLLITCLIFSNYRRGKKIIFDIGANIGEYTNLLETYATQHNITTNIHLFEPTTSCFNILSKKYSDKKHIILNNFGVSDQDNTAIIYYDKEKSGLASLYQRNLESYDIKLNKTEKVKIKRLDQYIEEKEIKHIDFIKIDIEGHELNAFKGIGKYLNADFIDYIQFEYGGANLDSGTSLMELFKYLHERGFRLAKVLTNGLEIRNYLPYMENYNYANYVAISKRII